MTRHRFARAFRSIHPRLRLAGRSPGRTAAWIGASLSFLALLAGMPMIAAGSEARHVPVGRTLEAAPGYPRIHVQLAHEGVLVTGEPLRYGALQSLQQLGQAEALSDVDEMLDQMIGGEQGPADSFQAFLDTGASGYVLSKTTAERFALQREPGAIYHEVGLHGEIRMDVSEPYALALADSSGQLQDEPDAFQLVEREARLLLKREAPQNPVIEVAMGPIDIVGMPAIRQFVVELDPAPMTGAAAALEALEGASQAHELESDDPLDALDALIDEGGLLEGIGQIGTGPAVTLHDANHQPPDVDLVIDMRSVDLARRNNPRDAGPLPALAAHPMIVDVETEHGQGSFTTDWLLDTGAPISIISTEHAAALGLYDAQGQPTRSPDFTMPLGGVGGQINPMPGYRIDELRVPAADGRLIVYEDVSVLVTDISIELDSGETFTLGGLFGTNLLLPTVAGMGSGLPDDMAAGPYRRIWIDGPRSRMLLELR